MTKKSITSTPKSKWIGIGMMIACALLLGISHVLSRKLLVEQVHPMFAASVRNVIAALVILFFALLVGKARKVPMGRLHFDRWLTAAVVGRSLSGICYYYSLLTLTATAGIMLYRLTPIYTLILLLAFSAIRKQGMHVLLLAIGVLLAVAGAILGIWQTGDGVDREKLSVVGIGLMLLAGPFFSLFIVSWENHKASNVGNADFSIRQHYLARIELLAAIPIVLLTMFLTIFQEVNIAEMSQWIELAILGLVIGLVGVLYFEAVKRIGALLASVIVGIEVHFTILFEWSFLGQPVTMWAIIGGVLLLIGAVIVSNQSHILIQTSDDDIAV